MVCYPISEDKLGDEDERKKFLIEWIRKVQLCLYVQWTEQLNETKQKKLKTSFLILTQIKFSYCSFWILNIKISLNSVS